MAGVEPTVNEFNSKILQSNSPKNKIRREIQEKRQGLLIKDMNEWQKGIVRHAIHSPLIKEVIENCTTFMVYASFGNEVGTEQLINDLIRLGKKVSLPLIRDMKNRKMVAIAISDFARQTQLNPFGIPEPFYEKNRETHASSLDVIFTPGLAFDLDLNRLGYGGGFYDRYINQLRPDCIKIGLSFEFQIYGKLPITDYDRPMDIVITEERILRKTNG